MFRKIMLTIVLTGLSFAATAHIFENDQQGIANEQDIINTLDLDRDSLQSRVLSLNDVCFPDGYNTKRCYNSLDTLQLLSNEKIVIIASCKSRVRCPSGSPGTRLEAKVIIVD
jgi:hypothetical protein